MAYRLDEDNSIVIDGFEKGIASSPYTGIANMRNVGISYYPSVAYTNYSRQSATISGSNGWFAGTHSTNVSNNVGWIFTAPASLIMANPVAKAVSPAGLIYVLDTAGQIWKQSAVNSSTFNILDSGAGRITNGATGLAYWNNYLFVFGNNTIEICGNGTNDSGVISTNWNVTSSSSTVTPITQLLFMNSSYSSESYAWTGTVTAGLLSATLTSTWTGASGTYMVQFNNVANDQRNVVFTTGLSSVSWSGGLTNDASTSFLMYQFRVTNGASFAGSTLFTAGTGVTFTSSGTLPTGITAGTTYYLMQNVDLSTSKTFFVAASSSDYINGRFLSLTDGGSGTITMTMVPSIAPPIQNTTITGFTWSANGIGSTSITLASVWTSATGIYNIVDPQGNQMLASFTYASTTVALLNPATVQALPAGTFQVNIINPTSTSNKTWISKVDGSLYFANGRWVGRISSSVNANTTFNPGLPASYSVNYSATGCLQPQDTVVDMTDLRGQMIIAGNYDIYPWDYVSAQPSASSPIGEQIVRITNLLNNVYITAGQKGNIYVSNGASAQILYKIPDYIAGVIDPVWTWGDMMIHRGRLYLQALAQNTSGSNLLQGVFSFNVSSTLVTDVQTAGAFTMEAQNSNGLIPGSGTTGAGLLIDNEPSSSGQDSYYSVYSTGASTGIIDYNNTTLWANFEPTIETDIVPIGTFLTKKTLSQVEFKLDRPMVSGDQIRLYARQSLSDSFVAVGTTSGTTFTNQQLSDVGITNGFQWQWVQLKAQFKCAGSGSSFIPLREIRVYTN